MKTILLRVTPDELAAIDRVRGKDLRTNFIRAALSARCAIQPPVPKVARKHHPRCQCAVCHPGKTERIKKARAIIERGR